MIPEDMLEEGQLRLLDVDNPIVIPVNTHVRFVVSAADVIHCFAIPSLGLKIDATPGRLNQVSTLVQRTGVYYGQCSELCGIQHFGMPLKVEVVELPSFLNFLENMSQNED